MPEESKSGISGRPFWSGTITFGLVSIPLEVLAANRASRVPLKMLGPTGTALRREYHSSETGKRLKDRDLVRGYEIESGRYVLITDQELEKLAPENSRDIDLRVFVPEDAIPRLHFERSYWLAPAKGSAKAYRLLAKTMEKTERAGVATFVMRGKEHLVAIFSDKGILRAETLRFSDEIRSPEDVGLPEKKPPAKADVSRLSKMIDGHLARNLPLKEMHEDLADRMRRLADKKYQHEQDVVEQDETPERTAETIDLMTRLKRSLEETRPLRGGSKKETRPPSKELSTRSRGELYQRARELNIPGRSKMTRAQLARAIRDAA